MIVFTLKEPFKKISETHIIVEQTWTVSFMCLSLVMIISLILYINEDIYLNNVVENWSTVCLLAKYLSWYANFTNYKSQWQRQNLLFPVSSSQIRETIILFPCLCMTKIKMISDNLASLIKKSITHILNGNESKPVKNFLKPNVL